MSVSQEMDKCIKLMEIKNEFEHLQTFASLIKGREIVKYGLLLNSKLRFRKCEEEIADCQDYS